MEQSKLSVRSEHPSQSDDGAVRENGIAYKATKLFRLNHFPQTRAHIFQFDVYLKEVVNQLRVIQGVIHSKLETRSLEFS
jgi:hypothetical protein